MLRRRWPPLWTRGARLLAACLTLVAAGLYPLRTLPLVPAAHAPAHHSSPVSAPEHAHCLFCLTGAFATAPPPGPVLLPACPSVPDRPILVLRLAAAPAGLPDARAPPQR
ncbi:hypothetical protein [Deinococcus sp. YIM 77859]|uniref:hypothetical protein n=1 Tax=Deinococcus sp. YIM 77859 TaxID=1540221 RepID=UPI0005581444|nr:hypothetical protein [Deinococcus sp. YIM 77859]